MKPKVPVQKGKVKVETNSYKNMPYNERVSEKKEELAKLRDNRDMKVRKK